MDFLPHRRPAIATSIAARPIAISLLLLLLGAYFFIGWSGREAWRSFESEAFAYIYLRASAPFSFSFLSSDLHASLLGAWLPYFISSLFLSPWLSLAEHLPFFISLEGLARLPGLVALFFALRCIQKSTYLLAQTPDAQPLAMAFGGQASPVQYAKALSDASLLAMMATLGLALMAHEIGVSAWHLLSSAWLFQISIQYLLSTSKSTDDLNNTASKRLALPLKWLIASLWALLCGVGYLSVLSALLMALGFIRRPTADFDGRSLRPLAWAFLAFIAWALFLIYVLGLSSSFTWSLKPINTETLSTWLKLLSWYLWPVWLLWFWALWSWRHSFLSLHIFVPFVFSLVIFVSSFFAQAPSRVLIMALPASIVLGIFALPTLKRSVTALMDWFALFFFTGGAFIIWGIWLSLTTGFLGPKPAERVYRLLPELSPRIDAFHLTLALILTLAWIGIIVWRVSRHRPALWKSLVLSASGTTLCWGLLMTLWLPLLNQGFGYKTSAQNLIHFLQTQQASCIVIPHDLQASRLAAFKRYGPFIQWLDEASTANTFSCPWRLQLSSSSSPAPLNDYQHRMRIIQSNHRGQYYDLYQKAPIQ